MGPTIEDKQLRGQQVAEDLQGTCKSLYDVLTDEEQDDEAIMLEIDQKVFLCPECDWWCERSEETDDGRCDDCNPEGED